MSSIPEDKKLVEEAKQKSGAFSALYNRYVEKIYKYFLFRVNKNKTTAEDLTQETFLRAFKKISSFKDMGYEFSAYLFKIAHNLLVNHYRSPKELPLEKASEEAVDMETNIETKFQADIILANVNSLSQNQQEIFRLRYLNHMSIKEIAVRTGKTENAVKLTLSRNRKKLK